MENRHSITLDPASNKNSILTANSWPFQNGLDQVLASIFFGLSEFSGVAKNWWRPLLLHAGRRRRGRLQYIPREYPEVCVSCSLALRCNPSVSVSCIKNLSIAIDVFSYSLMSNSYVVWSNIRYPFQNLNYRLKEFCIVCATTYVLNGGCFTCFYLEYRAKERSKKLGASGGGKGKAGKPVIKAD